MMALLVFLPLVLAAEPLPMFTSCKDEACYNELVQVSTNATRLAAFCTDSYVTDKSHAEQYNLTVSSSSGCGDVQNMDTIRPLCDCVAKEVNATWNGAGVQGGGMKVDEANNNEKAPKSPELDPNLNTADFLFPDCVKLPCYSFLDITFDSPQELKAYCEKAESKQGSGLDQQTLEEHQCKDTKPACDCVRKAKGNDALAGEPSPSAPEGPPSQPGEQPPVPGGE
ncbi:hypothetical protein XA68_15053 [Ophiocordyceps unilateralis]|uniref:Uncharacterized protein n=1 Tax=Ophiocordyceps unilateralis TaxID=268505 RepID=A0A2A9P7E7_OPHUN|nr:hypothetical protein XA68_15053 [Ophiocordyceps unilateralis]